MGNGSWQRAIRLCLAILCIAAVNGAGGAAAIQRGDASLPTGDAEWVEAGRDFVSPDQPPTSVMTGDTYVLPATGTEVVVAEGVNANDPAESSFEDQVLFTIPGGIGAVAVIQGLGFPLGIMEAYVEGFAESMDNVEEVDVQEDRSTATGLYIVLLDGDPLYFFITVDAATTPGSFIIQVAVTAIGGVDETIVQLRENVFVDGIPMFNNVDEHSIQESFDAHSGN